MDVEKKSWEYFALRSAFFGIGFSLILIIVIGGYFWYESRPKPQKPWDNNAIVAFYDIVDTRGENNTIVFRYTLENKTDYDYSIKDKSDFLFYANLNKQRSLSGGTIDEYLNIDYPIFIPSKHRLRVNINLNYSTTFISPTLISSKEEKEKHFKELNNYINTEITNLDGFTLFDETKRYKIEFPAGWKTKQ